MILQASENTDAVAFWIAAGTIHLTSSLIYASPKMKNCFQSLPLLAMVILFTACTYHQLSESPAEVVRR